MNEQSCMFKGLNRYLDLINNKKEKNIYLCLLFFLEDFLEKRDITFTQHAMPSCFACNACKQ